MSASGVRWEESVCLIRLRCRGKLWRSVKLVGRGKDLADVACLRRNSHQVSSAGEWENRMRQRQHLPQTRSSLHSSVQERMSSAGKRRPERLCRGTTHLYWWRSRSLRRQCLSGRAASRLGWRRCSGPALSFWHPDLETGCVAGGNLSGETVHRPGCPFANRRVVTRKLRNCVNHWRERGG